MSRPVTLAVVGLGYWGPNLLRCFARLAAARVKYVCDLDPELCASAARQYPSVIPTRRLEDVIVDAEVEAVVIATPVSTHHALTKRAIEAGKHVLVEKPIASTSIEARDLATIAEDAGRCLLVDHTFLYEEAVRKLREYAKGGTLGRLLYFDSTRINLGLHRSDTSALWDLAIHDLSILDALRPLSEVTSVLAHGQKHYTDREEIVHLHLEFQGGFRAHIAVSWLSPVKIRQTLVGGTEKMLVYDDNQPSEKIRLYDRGIQVTKEEQTFALPIYRTGSVLIPYLQNVEPLLRLAEHFVACVRGKDEPLTPAEQAVRILEILELADCSMRERRTVGRP
ncbi:MAG: Gfo/Idh/MocA family oxidoreductase [Polyangiaceae bacterium]|nr:Gfo/Idh/MocA family oxidoreductase [Polyangiaceae bacterium]